MISWPHWIQPHDHTYLLKSLPSRVIDFFLTHYTQEDTLHGQRIGYVRVSSFDQNPERQLEHV
jgi:C-terminal processing protease CtpA/Prc